MDRRYAWRYKNDFARPPVQARNFYHLSLAMYDAWAIYDTTEATRVLFGKSPALFHVIFTRFQNLRILKKIAIKL